MANYFKAHAGAKGVSGSAAKSPDAPAAIPDRRSLCDHGPYSAYCTVCWYPVYVWWIDAKPHGGVCIDGCTQADRCREAMNRAESDAVMIDMLREQAGQQSDIGERS
jgi:hypothetical protein